jgi:hypothetical protein
MTAVLAGAPPGEVAGRHPHTGPTTLQMTATKRVESIVTRRGVLLGMVNCAPVVPEQRVRDVKRSIPGFDVWRWRPQDRRWCDREGHCYVQPCPEHGCPFCFLEDCGGYGYGTGDECAKCDALCAEEFPDPECVNGDDCLTCEQCWIPAPPGHNTNGLMNRCLCKVPICRHCELCADHVQKVGGYRGRPNHGGYPVDELGAPLDCRHSWRDPITGLWS